MYNAALLTTATLLTLFSGAMFGQMSARWGQDELLADAGEMLSQFPTEFGSWRVLESYEMDELSRDMLQCAGNINRVYIEQETGSQVRMFAIVGPHGPTAVHTPEVCYSSKEYAVIQNRREINVGDGSDTAWHLAFKSNSMDGQVLDVYYAWSDGKGWQAAASPRFDFAGSPLLYKVQLATFRMADDSESHAGEQFLREFFAAAKGRLVTP